MRIPLTLYTEALARTYAAGAQEEEGLPKWRKTAQVWADAQRDGRPAEHRWRPLLNAAKFC